MRRKPQSAALLAIGLIAGLGGFSTAWAQPSEGWPEGLRRVREDAAAPLVLAKDGRAGADIVLLSESELVRNAAEWIARFVQQQGGGAVTIRSQLKEGGSHVLAAIGETHPLIRRLQDAGRLGLEPRVGAQGFVLQRVSDPVAGDLLVCWSPGEAGCRYGLIEVLRSLRLAGQSVIIPVGRVVERPQFPMRICYLNFAEHLQNAWNPNLLFDTPVNRWTLPEWERFIDMVSAFRYNVFEFWLVPSLFSPEAMRGGKVQAAFAETMNHVIAYARRRGVGVHPIQAVNTVGQQWHYHCPKDPKERAEIVALWDHWSRALQGNEFLGFFPGDPGGCTRNGCTAETFVDLCLELAGVVRKNNPSVRLEVGTWGEPFGGWGVGLWTGKPDRAEKAMKYFLAKLPEFPPGTFTSINLGFSPDCTVSHGGDGRPYAREAARTRPVLTWDYSVTEGEGAVIPHCRVRRMLARRQEELAQGCYSGGICYTMSPRLNCLSIFCCAEAYWDPGREPESILADYGRFVFGPEQAAIGPLLEEFEVVPDWGYYAPFPYSPARLQRSMGRLRPLLEQVAPKAEPRLPLAPTMAEYRKSLLFFADLFGKLATVARDVEEMTALARESGRTPADRKELVSLSEAGQLLAAQGEFLQKERLRRLAEELRQLDARELTRSYRDTVYGIYSLIPNPVDPRAQGATLGFARLFHCDLAMAQQPSPLEKTLRASGQPFLLVTLGQPAGERGWSLNGWTNPDEYEGESWRASFDQPGIIARDDFVDRGYHWLVIRLTEGSKGGRKSIAINGRAIGEFIRSGPPREQKPEWWVTRSFPVPPGLLRDGRLEIRFTGPGIAISAVALATEPVNTEQ